MNEVIDILSGIMNDIENDVIHSLQSSNRVATGKTIAEFQTIVAGNTAQLLVPKFIDTLEYGRAPTRPGVPAGDPTVFEAIKEWCAARGIDESAAYAITKKIHKFGYEGTPGVLTEPLSEDNINMRMDTGLKRLADNFGHEVANLFNTLETA